MTAGGYLPEDIVNQALDVLPGNTATIGSFTDGSDESELARRFYGQTLRGLLRAAHWDWARKRQRLLLLGANAQAQPIAITPGPVPPEPTLVSNVVEPPWWYAYAWPFDAVRARWLPWSGQTPGNIFAPPGNVPQPGNPNAVNVPNVGNDSGFGPFVRERPARFLITSSDQYPALTDVPDWTEQIEYGEGTGPTNRRIILTNVQNAQLVYTYLALEIEIWDELFRAAMFHVLASMFAPRVIKNNPQIAIAERNAHIQIAKTAIREARVASAQEQGFPQSTDTIPDWMRVRRFGYSTAWAGWGGEGEWGAGLGYLYCGWDSFSFGDGSVF